MSGLLKLMAEDAADLDIIAAAAQDALVRVGDISFDKKARRFALLINRFRWEEATEDGPFERIRSALSFDSVLSVKSRKVRLDAPDALASVLSVGFTPAEEPPGGEVRVVLAGGGEILLDVECLDALLLDIGATWRTPRRPDHEEA
jgi:hypothetical protein